MKTFKFLKVSCWYMRGTKTFLVHWWDELGEGSKCRSTHLQSLVKLGCRQSGRSPLIRIFRYEMSFLNHILNSILLKPNYFLHSSLHQCSIRWLWTDEPTRNGFRVPERTSSLYLRIKACSAAKSYLTRKWGPNFWTASRNGSKRVSWCLFDATLAYST